MVNIELNKKATAKPEKENEVQSFSRGSFLSTLHIPFSPLDNNNITVKLDNILLFQGLEKIVCKLLDEIRESCFNNSGDISASIDIELEDCPILEKIGINKISFFHFTNEPERLPFLYKSIANELRDIFNAIQNPSVNEGFFNPDLQESPIALLFSSDNFIEEENIKLNYLVEFVSHSHLLRFTVEDIQRSRLNVKSINHREISTTEKLANFFTINQHSYIIFSTLINLCREYKLSYKDSGMQLSELLGAIKMQGYSNMREISINWTSNVVQSLLSEEREHWHSTLNGILLVLSDPIALKLLSEGKTISIDNNGQNAYLSFTQRGRNLQIDLDKKKPAVQLSKYLYDNEFIAAKTKLLGTSLEKTHILFITPFTQNTLIMLGAFEKMHAYSVDVLITNSAETILPSHIETALSLPESCFRFLGLKQAKGKHSAYKYCLSDKFSSIEDLAELQWWLEVGEFDLFHAIQRIGLHLLFNSLAHNKAISIVIIEDDAYLTSALTEYSSSRLSIAEVFETCGYENGLIPYETKSGNFNSWLNSGLAGSIEFGLNVASSTSETGKNIDYFPFKKVLPAEKLYESEEIAHTCINVIENLLNSTGRTINERNWLILGTQNNIGEHIKSILNQQTRSKNITGVLTDGSQKSNNSDYLSIDDLPDSSYENSDMIFCISGNQAANENFFEKLIFQTHKRQLFLASGTTRNNEFIPFINWIEKLQTEKRDDREAYIINIEKKPIENQKSWSCPGTLYSIEINTDNNVKKLDLYLFNNGNPIYLQQYGIVHEALQESITECLQTLNSLATAKNEYEEQVLEKKQLNKTRIIL